MSTTQQKLKKSPHNANTLAQIRRRRGLSQAQAARLVGCRTRQKIAGYERGERLPQLPRAMALAAAYRVPVEQLFPDLWAQIQSEVTQRRNELATALNKSTLYEPVPNTTTLLALYPGTRKVGMAVFEALASR